MKALYPLVAAGFLGLALNSALAQDPPAVSPTQDPSTITPTPISPERVGRVISPEAPKGNLEPINATADRPALVERNQLPPAVNDKIRIFRSEADKWVREQDELRKRILGAATDAERQRIREQIRQLRERWLEQQRTIREEFRDRQKELQEQLPSRREMLREAAQEQIQNIREGAQDRRRRGIDR